MYYVQYIDDHLIFGLYLTIFACHIPKTGLGISSVIPALRRLKPNLGLDFLDEVPRSEMLSEIATDALLAVSGRS
jgi:hypothetical protein